MFRLILAAIVVIGCAGARPAGRADLRGWDGFPTEQQLTRQSVPLSRTADFSTFGLSLGLDGEWLAVAEQGYTLGDVDSLYGQVHLFRRERVRPWLPKRWIWSRAFEATQFGALPLAMEGGFLAFPGPFPSGLLVYARDSRGEWSLRQDITELASGGLGVIRQLAMRGSLMAVTDHHGDLHLLALDPTGSWQPELSIPGDTLDASTRFALGAGKLAVIRAGSPDSPARIEVLEQGEVGSWVSSGFVDALELDLFAGFFPSGVSLAFDGDDLLALLQQSDFIGNPIAWSLHRFRKSGSSWQETNQTILPTQSAAVETRDGLIIVYGHGSDLLGNPVGGEMRVLDRRFRSCGSFSYAASAVALDGRRFATTDLVFDFLGNAIGGTVRVHRNPWAGWFRR